MREYVIIPEARYNKLYLILAVAYFLIAVALGFMGHFVTAVGYILACIFLFCSLYYGVLFFYYKYYQVHVSFSSLIVTNIRGKQIHYSADTIRWKIIRIPWYNSFYLFLYTTQQTPVAVVRPHWRNAPRILRFPHHGKLTPVELQYIKFMKNVGLL